MRIAALVLAALLCCGHLSALAQPGDAPAVPEDPPAPMFNEGQPDQGAGEDPMAMPSPMEAAAQDRVPATGGGCSCNDCDDWQWCDGFHVKGYQTVDYVTNLALPFALTPNNASVLQDDFQFQTLAGAYYELPIEPGVTSFSVGYDYYQSLHPKVQELDLNGHIITARLATKLSDDLVVSLDYSYLYYFLQYQSFVSQNRPGVQAEYAFNSEWSGKYGFFYGQADYRIDPNLDAPSYAPAVELYRYFDPQHDDYIGLGYSYGSSDARLRAYAYDVQGLFVSSRCVFDAFNKRNELQFLGSYGFYQFKAPDVIQTDVFRQDSVFTLGMRLSRQVCEHFDIFAQYRWYSDESNVIRQDYDSDLFSVGVDVAW